MNQNTNVSGLGRPVRPLIRVLAGVIGAAGIVGFALAASLWWLGAPQFRLNVGTAFDLLAFVAMAAYGTSIAVRGKAPRGIVPWR
jgi:hypothetical protein